MASDDIPEWAIAYFQDCRNLLGIGPDWHLYLRMADKPGDEDDADGMCTPDARYLNATITLKRGLDEEVGRAVIMHELFHVVLAPMALAAQRVNALLPKAAQLHAATLTDDAEEQVIQRLTRALQQNIKPPSIVPGQEQSNAANDPPDA